MDLDFFQVIEQRHSVREFDNQFIEDVKLKTILYAANLAPSAGNLQAYHIYVIKNYEKLFDLASACVNQWFIHDAPLALVFCACPFLSEQKYGERGKLYSIEDATIACTYAQLAATALGLGSTWIGAFYENKIRKIIGVDENIFPVSVLVIGYYSKSPEITPRRDLSIMVDEVK